MEENDVRCKEPSFVGVGFNSGNWAKNATNTITVKMR